jgi:hypothetical protein
MPDGFTLIIYCPKGQAREEQGSMGPRDQTERSFVRISILPNEFIHGDTFYCKRPSEKLWGSMVLAVPTSDRLVVTLLASNDSFGNASQCFV